MLISLLLVAIATAGGFAITHLIDEDAPLMWRLSAGNVIGCAIFGSLGFALCLAFGLNSFVVIAAGVLTMLPILVVYRPEYRKRVRNEWLRSKSRLQGASIRRGARFAYYAFFFLLFFFFFDRAMLESGAGIYTGGSQNLGDLPFHLGAIFSFTEANNFPPENPSFAGARFSYPFVADLLTAFAVKLGAGVRDALFVQNLAWAFSLLIILERFTLMLTKNRLAARLAPPLLFFSGGLGFVWFLGDYWSQSKSFFDFLNALPKDYTISDQFRWGNSMVVLFMTQRSLLLGMPLTLVILGYLWRIFSAKEGRTLAVPENLPTPPPVSPIIIGLLAGLLPLVHLHSLAVLFVVGVCLLILRPERWIAWTLFATGVAVVAIPELLWSMAGSASESAKFFAWHFGWDKRDRNFLSFWFTNSGIVIPMVIAGLYVALALARKPDLPQSRKDVKKKDPDPKDPETGVLESPLVWFYVPFALLFLVSNTAKLAPWEWDNIKVLIYWFVGSLPLIALVIAWLWEKKEPLLKLVAAACFVVLTASGVLDVWRCVSGQVNYKVFDSDAVEIARQIRVRTPVDAIVLNAPTYNTATVLSGRQSVMRYPGHLGSHGIDYGTRESDVKRIYQGSPDAAALLEKYGVTHVLVSPEERSFGAVNEQFLNRFPVAAESGQYKVYKVR